MNEIQEKLRRLERRDWGLWWAAVTVILLLTGAVVSLSLPSMLRESDHFFELNLNLAVRGLVGLVLLFNLYTVYQQMLIKRMRKEMAETVMKMASLQVSADESYKLATLDPLTGLCNRRLAQQRLAGEVSRSQRYGHPLTVLMMDLNGFKQINDRYGHGAGDHVLRVFAGKLSKVIRASDLAVRMGGDEFMVVLPECQPQQVRGLLERLGPVECDIEGEKVCVTFAAGWAGYEQSETPEQIIERADQALYEQKRARAKSPTIAAR